MLEDFERSLTRGQELLFPLAHLPPTLPATPRKLVLGHLPRTWRPKTQFSSAASIWGCAQCWVCACPNSGVEAAWTTLRAICRLRFSGKSFSAASPLFETNCPFLQSRSSARPSRSASSRRGCQVAADVLTKRRAFRPDTSPKRQFNRQIGQPRGQRRRPQ